MLEKFFDLTGRVALVSGAAQGLGRAMSLALAEAGADLMLVDRNHDGVRRTADEIARLGRRATPPSAGRRRFRWTTSSGRGATWSTAGSAAARRRGGGCWRPAGAASSTSAHWPASRRWAAATSPTAWPWGRWRR